MHSTFSDLKICVILSLLADAAETNASVCTQLWNGDIDWEHTSNDTHAADMCI